MVEGYAHVGGRVVPLAGARVDLLDRGHLLGDGVFETMRGRGGHVLHRDLHARRLANGLRLLGAPEAGEAAWSALDEVHAAAARSAPELLLRLQVTTGVSEDFAGTPGRTAITAMAKPLRPYPAEAYERGISVEVAQHSKPGGPFSAVKTVSFLPHVAARRAAHARGLDDALLLNEAGRVCEATTSNAFAVVEGEIHSPGPEESAVDGVTRGRLIERLEAESLRIHPRLAVGELSHASELFLTNTIGGVVPVRELHGRRLPGPTGPFYRRAKAHHEALDALVGRPGTA